MKIGPAFQVPSCCFEQLDWLPDAMHSGAVIVAAFIASAIVSGLLLALLARTQGVDHTGILIAVGVMGGGIQMLLLIIWYLHHTSDRTQRQRAEELADLKEPSLDRIDGR